MSPISKHSQPFKYQDQITLQGHFNKQGPRHIIINDHSTASLGPAQFIVAVTLASHSLAKAGIEAPIRTDTDEYLSAEQIRQAIDNFLKGLQNDLGVLASATSTEITTEINLIRNKIYTMGFRGELITTGPGLRGYRFEVAPEKIRLHTVHPDTGVVRQINYPKPA